jgi:3'-phosphoadenosine 5'-phosphosulfate sulfotransferase (PAPS reductase)/FAD synthetase
MDQVEKRIVCWFSCGAASAVATKLAIADNNNKLPLIIVYTEVLEEHSDNKRFLADCEKWFGQEIIVLGNDFYDRSIYKVFEKNYMRTPHGSPCTRALKKQVRQKFERATDIQIFGYTIEEQHRFDRFLDSNNIDVQVPLIEKGLTKTDCLAMLQNANIELPEMYKLGYHNNNCIGCVKGGKGYWNKIRVDFPETFDRMAKLERFKNQTVFKDTFLDEMPLDAGNYPEEQDIQCGIFCLMAEQDYK